MALNREGLQIGVAILPSLQGESLEEATHEIASKWGVGGKDQSDGALIAVFMSDRKMRIEVGYGLEEKVPDATARQIISTRMRPAFRNGRFAEGVMGAIDGVASATGRAVPAHQAFGAPARGFRYSTRAEPVHFGGLVCPCLAFFALMAFLRLLSKATRPRNYGFGRRQTYAPGMPWWAWMLLGNAMSGGHHRRGGWGGGGGGGFGGGGGGSFGGGSFGGGGASGSW